MSKSYKRINQINIPIETITPENKCSFCTGSLCCTYITQHIETPRAKIDFEHLLWQISHDHVRVYKDEDGWTLLFESKCLHLQLNGDCGIYENTHNLQRSQQ